ncbi:MAG TPA: Uma2 family endonuclease, partial [Gammaproteobacteria bacterium]|nr:Uma2 family endonuclease [Gammaproteobacteria bacterium]
TYADLVAVPDNFVAEILAGELYASPRPIFTHMRVASALGVLLGGPFQFRINGPGGWLLVDEPELHLGADVLVPDLAGWRTEKAAAASAAAYPTVAPDWICEVLSRSTETIDRGHKLRIYEREAVGHIWLMDPVSQTLEVMQRARRRWSLLATHRGGQRVRAAPFEAVELELAAVWVSEAERT